MGILTATGCCARVVGPIFITYVYNASGLYLTFGLVEILMVISLVLVLVTYRKLVPLKVEGLEMEVQVFGGH
jgi:ceroid-lipofuscinosis MFS transporter 7